MFHSCSWVSSMTKKAICKHCGAVNEINAQDLAEDDVDDWLACDLPMGFEWSLPAGKISPVYGDPIYVSAQGQQMSREEFILEFNVDPEIAYQNMRSRMGRQSFSKSTNQSSKDPAMVSAKALRSQFLLDDDDWKA